MKNLLNKLSSVSFVDQGYSHQIPTKIIIVTFFFFSFFFLKANYFGKPYYQI